MRHILPLITARLMSWFDRTFIDGLVNGLAFVTLGTSESLKYSQSGRVQQYAMVIVVAIVLLTFLLKFT